MHFFIAHRPTLAVFSAKTINDAVELYESDVALIDTDQFTDWKNTELEEISEKTAFLLYHQKAWALADSPIILAARALFDDSKTHASLLFSDQYIKNETAQYKQIQALKWKWYLYGPHPDYPDAWVVKNIITDRSITTSSESACLKIIELAYALKNGHEKPFNMRPLEQKAKNLENIPLKHQQYFNWNGKKLTYNTGDYE